MVFFSSSLVLSIYCFYLLFLVSTYCSYDKLVRRRRRGGEGQSEVEEQKE